VLINFFLMLRSAGIPVSLTEFLSLMDGLAARLAGYSIDDLYYLSRIALVKDERHFDRFDLVFGAHFEGIEVAFADIAGEVPEEWLRRQAELQLSEEEKRRIASLGGWEKLMETLRERLEEQKGRHQGGSKWIGTFASARISRVIAVR